MSACACMGPIPGTNVCHCGIVFGDSAIDTKIFSHTPDWNKAVQDRTRSAPQGVAEVMEQAQVFASTWSLAGGQFDAGDGFERAQAEKEDLRRMVAAIVQERDALKARVDELEGDVADAVRYRWLTEDHSDAQTRKERRALLDRMPVMSYSAASRDIDAAIASAKEPHHG